MTLDQYIGNINRRSTLGNAREHTFCGDLQSLIETLVPDIRATNEPKRLCNQSHQNYRLGKPSNVSSLCFSIE